MRVEEKFFCTPQTHGGVEVKDYSFLAFDTRWGTLSATQIYYFLTAKKKNGTHRMEDEVDTIVSMDAFEKRWISRPYREWNRDSSDGLELNYFSRRTYNVLRPVSRSTIFAFLSHISFVEAGLWITGLERR